MVDQNVVENCGHTTVTIGCKQNDHMWYAAAAASKLSMKV